MCIRKAVCIMIALSLVISLAACEGKDDYGTIEDVEITVPAKEKESASAFEKEEPPFDDYKYSEIEFECANLAFDAPSSWKMQIYNQSCLRFDVPSDDSHFPGTTCYVKCVYEYDASKDNFDNFARYASEFGKVMSPYITGLPYKYNGKDLWIKNYSVSNSETKPGFTKDETVAIIRTTDELTIINKNTGDTASFSGNSLVAGYFRWQGFPVMISMVIPSNNAQQAEKLISYMMSSAAVIPHKISQVKTVSAGRVSLVVPSYFENTGSIFRAPCNDIKSCSGMAVGVFSVEDDIDNITESYFQNTYGDSIASSLLEQSAINSYDISQSCYESKEPPSGVKKAFNSTVNILAKEADYISATLPYGLVSVWYMDSFVVQNNENAYIIATIYPPNEKDIAAKVEETMLNSVSLK